MIYIAHFQTFKLIKFYKKNFNIPLKYIAQIVKFNQNQLQQKKPLQLHRCNGFYLFVEVSSGLEPL